MRLAGELLGMNDQESKVKAFLLIDDLLKNGDIEFQFPSEWLDGKPQQKAKWLKEGKL